MIKLNLGCGYDRKAEYVNVDQIKTPASDILADLHHLPFKKNAFNEVYLSHVLEHILEPDKALKEVHRISKLNGKIIIRVPHAFTHSNFLNPTHRTHFLIGTILYWTCFREFGEPLFKLEKTELKAGRRIWNILLNASKESCEHLVFPIWLLNPEIVYTLSKL